MEIRGGRIRGAVKVITWRDCSIHVQNASKKGVRWDVGNGATDIHVCIQAKTCIMIGVRWAKGRQVLDVYTGSAK